MNEYLPFLLAGYLAMSLGLVSPGPNILAIVGTSMSTSRSAGIALACGVSAGSVIWAILATTGVTALMAAYAPIAFVLKLVGGLYLLYLGSKYLRAARSGTRLQVQGNGGDVGFSRYFGRGILIQLTNPKAVLSWLAIVAIVSRPDAPVWVLAAFVAGCGALAFIFHIGWALAFSGRRVIEFFDRFARAINTVLGALFGALGAGLIFSAFKTGSKTT